MTRRTVKLALDLKDFDDTPFRHSLKRCSEEGIQFTSMNELGDTERHRRKLYELNKTCSKDIPARGTFFTFDEFCDRRFGDTYDPAGALIAIDQDSWIGMAATSNHSERGFAFNEMTGVLREYRRRGIALALKLLSIRFASSLPVRWVYTIQDIENTAAIDMNLRLGYQDTQNSGEA
jgi:hypothetical protein